jgi:hypothetical protein
MRWYVILWSIAQAQPVATGRCVACSSLACSSFVEITTQIDALPSALSGATDCHQADVQIPPM